MAQRSGIGIDVHPLVVGRPLMLGGINIPFDRGLDGHSDGDVLIHAIIDAILGAAGLDDIGTHFSSNDPQFKGIASSELLTRTLGLATRHGWRTTYVDATILAERPMLRPFRHQIREALAAFLNLEPESVNIKATTTDGLGLIGRGEGIASMAIATVERIE